MTLGRHWARLVALCLAAGFAVSAAWARPAETNRPNIVIILADDAGYADFGFQGSKQFRTPNIDTLAREGVVYKAAYATMPFCSPSRAALLTGRYSQRYGYEFNLTHAPPPGVDPAFMGLATGEPTIADRFKAAGYRTTAIGKWHVGSAPQFHPLKRGFDHFYGFLGGGSGYFPTAAAKGGFERDGTVVAPNKYLTDDLAREAVAQIAAHRNGPFLLYLAFNAVHTPMDARPEDMARFASIADPQRRRLAAMTWALDRAVGEVNEALKRNGLERNTLIVFTNDNGGDRIGLDADNAPLRGTKGTLLEGGIRVPLIVRFPGKAGAGGQETQPVSLIDILPTTLRTAGLSVPLELDGVPLAAVSRPSPERRDLFWRYDTMAAMRSGPWKLLRFPDRPPQLYDLDRDVSEATDLASAQPGRVAEMMKALFAWEATIEHARWHTGTFWSQEDVRRYSEAHIRSEIAKAKAELASATPAQHDGVGR